MKYIIIMAAVSSVVLYYITAEVVCRLKERSFRRRVFTGVLVAALLVSQTNIVNVFVGTEAATVVAAEQEAESGADAEETVEARDAEVRTVTAFTELPEDIREQAVPVGTALEELMLPDTLEAVCIAAEADSESEDIDTEKEEDTDISGNIVAIENITWQSEPEYDGDTEGEYIFTAVLPEGYVLTSGVNAPQITVTVGGINNIALLSDDGIMAVEAEEVEFGGGDGSSPDSAYEISTEAQLRKLADDVNGGEDYGNKYFKLTEDITLHGDWTPIGSNGYFSGNFDGGNHKIEGLNITSSTQQLGLFGVVANATIQNLSVKGNIEGSCNSGYVGGIAGEMLLGGVITNCSYEGTINPSFDMNFASNPVLIGGIVGFGLSGTEITNCLNEGTITVNLTDGESYVGGIAGRASETTKITNCQNTGSITAQDSYVGGIVGSSNPSSPMKEPIKNCYYKSDIDDAVGSGDPAPMENVEGKSPEQFASGEVAYLLQNPEKVNSSHVPQDGLVWGQNLGVDDFPGLVYFMEGDKEAKRVLKITLYDANTTGYTPYETYINNGATIKAAVGFEQISSQGQYPAETYETVGLSQDGAGDIFREDSPITEDNTVLYLFYKEKFSGNNGTITTPPGTEKTQDLDEQMEYAGDTSAAGNFTYEITDGNGKLGASLSGSTLTIPAAADIGSYTLTIKATEKNPTVKNLQKQEGVTIDSEDSVTFEVKVTVEKTDQDWIDEAIKVVQKALDEMNVTNETTKEDVQDVIDQALKEAGLEDVTATVRDDFTIEKATEESEGQITGTVALEKGKETDEVEIDKKIGKQESSSGGNTGDGGSTGSGGSTGGNNGGSSSESGNGSQSSGNNSGGTGTGNNAAGGTQTGTDTSGSTQTGSDITDDTQADVQTGTGTRNGRGNSTGTNRAGASSSSSAGSTDNQSSSQSASTDGTTNSTAEASSETGWDAGQSDASGTDGQTTGSTAQTVKAELKDGKITVEGDVVVTGTVRTAETTTKTLTVGEGAVIVTVVSDEYKGNAGVADTVAVANAVLTPEQIQRVNDGETIEIRVDVKDISSQVSQEDKDIIENGLADNKITGDIDEREEGELTLGAYIDISMYIRIGDGDWDAITRADEPIEVVIGIPEELQGDGRTYYIARAHEGEYALLEDLDNEPDTITIKTGMFSTYAIVFRQSDASGSTGAAGLSASLSWTVVALWSLGILVMLGIAVFLIFWKRRKDGGEAA